MKILNGNFFNTSANFIVNLCEITNTTNCITDKYPHVETEYRKYIRYCNKNKINIVGTTQYVPVDVWAITMIDTMKNDNIFEYDNDYQFIVNLTYANTEQGINFKVIKNGLMNVRKKAESLNGIVAIFCDKNKETTLYNIIMEVFADSDLEIEIWN
jgi:hypothetical protein